MGVMSARLFGDITDVLWLFQVDRVLLMIYQPGAEVAPLGDIFY